MKTPDRSAKREPVWPDDPAAAYEKAFNTALRSLTAASRTRHQVEQLLVRRGAPAVVIDRVLDRLMEVGLLNDVEFARRWANSRSNSRAASRRVLRMELSRKGISSADIDIALADIDADDEHCAAADLVSRKLASSTVDLTDHQQRLKLRQRMVNMLMRRGHSPTIAIGIVDDVLLQRTEHSSGADQDDEAFSLP